MGVVYLKTGVASKISRALLYWNPPSTNPGSATAPHWMKPCMVSITYNNIIMRGTYSEMYMLVPQMGVYMCMCGTW